MLTPWKSLLDKANIQLPTGSKLWQETFDLDWMREMARPQTEMERLCEFYWISKYRMNYISEYLDKWIDEWYYYIIDNHFLSMGMPVIWWFKAYKEQYDATITGNNWDDSDKWTRKVRRASRPRKKV